MRKSPLSVNLLLCVKVIGRIVLFWSMQKTWKLKSMIIDFRKNDPMHKVTYIKGQTVESVQSYKYLGTIIDSKPSFEANCEAV